VPSYNHPTVKRYSHGDGKVSGEMFATIDHFTVVSLVAWPLNESGAGIDLALIGNSLLFLS